MQTVDVAGDVANLLLTTDDALLLRGVIHEAALGGLGRTRFERMIGFNYDEAVGLRDRIDEELARSPGADITLTVGLDDVAIASRCLAWALDDLAGEEFEIRVGSSRQDAEMQREIWDRLVADLSG